MMDELAAHSVRRVLGRLSLLVVSRRTQGLNAVKMARWAYSWQAQQALMLLWVFVAAQWEQVS